MPLGVHPTGGVVQKETRATPVKLVLKVCFSVSFFVFMLVVTVRTGMQVSLWSAPPAFAANPWAMATLHSSPGF